MPTAWNVSSKSAQEAEVQICSDAFPTLKVAKRTETRAEVQICAFGADGDIEALVRSFPHSHSCVHGFESTFELRFR